jgi:hypothetical protein
MRVRYSKLIGSACIVAGIVLGVLALFSEDVSFVGALTPFAFLGFGVAFFTRPYLIIDDEALIVKALFGPAQQRHPLDSIDVIEFEGKRVFLIRDSVRLRLRGVTGWLADRHDWAAFRAWGEQRGGRG